MLFLSGTKAQKTEKQRQRQKQGTKRKQKLKTTKKKERKEQERNRERETEKRGRPKKAKERQRETLKNKQNMPFLGGKQFLLRRIPKKELFSYQSFFSYFLVGVQNFPFFDHLAQNARTPKTL